MREKHLSHSGECRPERGLVKKRVPVGGVSSMSSVQRRDDDFRRKPRPRGRIDSSKYSMFRSSNRNNKTTKKQREYKRRGTRTKFTLGRGHDGREKTAKSPSVN